MLDCIVRLCLTLKAIPKYLLKWLYYFAFYPRCMRVPVVPAFVVASVLDFVILIGMQWYLTVVLIAGFVLLILCLGFLAFMHMSEVWPVTSFLTMSLSSFIFIYLLTF